ncbi:MAG TPA: nucleoside hydrolase [Opitutaceae bacterium]|nr:nucleoside hydrolase [Opitutaceae bacterium]
MPFAPAPIDRRRAALAVAALLLGCSALASSPPRRRVIIDQDAFGGVNLQPMLMVIQAADVEVVGITVESGDGWQMESVAHTLRMLELVGRTDIPVAPGATYPLLNSEEETKRWEALYGRLPYKGAWMQEWPGYNTVNRLHYHGPDTVPPLPEGEPTTRPLAEKAAGFLARKVREAPGEISILALGPFTNIALAARLDEGFAANAKELVIMGGAFDPDGSKVDEFSLQFVNSPRVEFNCRWDPEAAKIMLHAGWRRITVVPTDATVGTKLTPELAREAGGADTPASRYFAHFGSVGFPMWDETAAAVWLEPAIVRRSDRLLMDIDIDHGAGYGSTLSWLPGFGPRLGEPTVTVVRSIDVPKLERLFVESMRRQAHAP